MAQNPIPEPYNPLVALAEDAADGAQQHEAAIGLLQNKEAAIRNDRAALTGAETDVLAKRAGKSAATAALRTADSNGKAFIALFVRTGKVTIASGSIFNIEINGTTAGTGFDQLAVTGSVNLGGATVSASSLNKSPKPKSAPAPTHSKRERRKPSPPLRHCSVPPDCRSTSSSAKHCCKSRRRIWPLEQISAVGNCPVLKAD